MRILAHRFDGLPLCLGDADILRDSIDSANDFLDNVSKTRGNLRVFILSSATRTTCQ